MRQHYYAVRYISAPEQIRIEKAESPEAAFKHAFGLPAVPVRGVSNAQWKDLGVHVSVIRSDARRIAILKKEEGWTWFLPPHPINQAAKESEEQYPHVYGPSTVGHGEAQCIYCHGTNRENAIIEPNHCSARMRKEEQLNEPEGPTQLQLDKRRIKKLERALRAMERCPGVDTTDQETGETFRTLIRTAMRAKCNTCVYDVRSPDICEVCGTPKETVS